MEPKYLLVLEPNGNPERPYTIYEQATISGQVGQRFYASFDNLGKALLELVSLNDGQPILLAYSTKPIDNRFSV